MRTMWKVTANGVYEKVIIRVYPESVLYMLCSKIHGTITRRKEMLSTARHKWFKRKEDAHKYFAGLRS